MDDMPPPSQPRSPDEPLHPSMTPVPESAPAPVQGRGWSGTPGSDLPPPPPAGPIPGASGQIPLRPMGAGEILDVAIRVYKANWKSLMGLVAIIVVPFTLLQNLVIHFTTHEVVIGGKNYFVTQADYNTFKVLTWVFFGLNILLVVPFLRGACARLVGGVYLGQRTRAGDSLRFTARRFWPLVGSLLLSSLIIGIGFVLLVIPGIIFFIRYAFVTQAIVVEDQSGTGSLTRSWNLAKGNSWRILGTLLLALILAGIVSAVLLLPLIGIFLSGGGGSSAWILRTVFNSLVSIVTTPFTITVAVLLYFDCRIRNEAFDVSVMAREVGQTPS
jgi:glycerophosphoryl diester phosphodiesterase family protein